MRPPWPPILDIDGVLKFLALEIALVNDDGYWIRASDYNIYQDEKRQFHVIPHDMNEAMMSEGGGRGRAGGPPPDGRMGGPPPMDAQAVRPRVVLRRTCSAAADPAVVAEVRAEAVPSWIRSSV